MADAQPVDRSETLIREVTAYIDANFDKPVKGDDLAKRFGVSISYLSHEFTRITGRSIYDYVLYRRIELARQMIHTDKSLQEIAVRCGFRDYSNFLRVFRKSTGISPSEFRRQIRPFGTGLRDA